MKKSLSCKTTASVLPVKTILTVFLLIALASSALSQTNWNGSISSNWFAAANWSSGVPTAATHVTIPSGTPNAPVINASGAVCNNLTVNSGASLTISGANDLTISGNFSNSGTFTAGSSTVTYNGAAQTVAPVIYHHLVLAGSGIKTITGLDTISGNFTMNGNNTTYAATNTNPSGPVLSIGGDMTIHAGNTFVATNGLPALNIHGNTSISGTVTSPGGGKNFYGDFTVNAGGSWTEAGVTPPYQMYGNITNNGTFTFNPATTTVTMQFLGNGKTVNGDLTVSALILQPGSSYTNTGTLSVLGNITNTGTLTQDAGATLNIGNNLASNAVLIATANGNTVNYNGSGNQTVRTANYYHLGLSGPGTTKSFTTSSYTIYGHLSIGANVTMDAAAGISLDLKGNFTNDGTFTANTSTVSFSGGSAQTINGASATTLYNLTMNNSSGLTLSQDVTISGALSFTNGIITSTAANLLDLTSSATASGGGAGKYIDGPIRKTGNSAFTFPTGKAGVYAPIGISAPALATDAFTAEYRRSTANALGSVSAPGLTLVSACEYWDLERSAGTSAVHVTLHWSGASPCSAAPYIGDPSTIVAAHFNGTNWNAFGNDGGITGDATSGSVTWNNVSSFSPFTIGTTNAQDNPLPVRFSSVKASRSSSGIRIDWTVLTEADVAYYAIERSVNGQSFEVIGQQAAIANNSQRVNYTWPDAAAPTGELYYRIRSEGLDGKPHYSTIVKISPDASAATLQVYPNPVTGGQVSFQCSYLAKGQYRLMIVDIQGKLLYSENFTHAGGAISQSLQLPASAVNGVYQLHIQNESGVLTRPFIVR